MDERIQARTQELVALQMGQLVLKNAALKAELDVRAEIAAAAAGVDSPTGARSAEQRTEEQGS